MNLLIAVFTKEQKLIKEIGVLYNLQAKSFDYIKNHVYTMFDKWVTFNRVDHSICKVMWLNPEKENIEWITFEDGYVASSDELYTPMYLSTWKNVKRITAADYVTTKK